MFRHSQQIIFLILILTGQYSLLLADCPPKNKLIKDYQAIVQGHIYPKYIALQTIIKQWESCQYAQDSSFVDLLSAVSKDASYYRMDTLAMRTAQRALLLANKSETGHGRDDLPKTLFRIGKLYSLLSDTKQATTYLQKTIAISNINHTLYWASVAASVLAHIAYNNGDQESSLNWSEKGIRWASQIGNKEALLRNQYERVRVLVDIRSKKEALLLLETIINQGHTIPALYLDVSLYYLTYGRILKSEGKFSQAEPYILKSLKFDRVLKNPEIIADTELSLGFFYYNQAKYDQALYYYNQSLQKAKDFNRKARLYDNIGAVYWMQKKCQIAITYYQKGLISLKTDLSDPLSLAANPSAESIRSSANKEYLLTLIQDKADTWLDYAKATNNRQRLKYALATYKVADQMIDYMRWEHTGQQSKLFWREKTRGLYERAIETCYLLKDTVQAFRFFEKSRAVMLADKLNELGARQKLTQSQVDKENELRKAVNDQQAQLAGLSPDSANYKSARMELFAKQERLDAFLKQLEISNPDYYRYKYDTTITTLADLRSRLNTQKASFVTYFVGDSALYVLGVTAGGVKVLRQPIKGYQQAMNDFMSLLWKPEAMNRKANFDKFLRVGQGLYQQLLAPLKLPAGRVIVSPDGSFVPFETLSRKVGTPEYLVNDYAFSYIYSARLLLKKNGGNSVKHGFNQLDFLGVAPVDFAPSLKQVMLPGSDTALASIARRFNSSKLLTHKEATRREFLTQATDARVIHLFTHATADSSDQEEPKLYFADSTLQLSELSDRALPNAQLVVLAACKTGIGANQRGEGVFSLARGFAALDVPSVLTTLWSVQNDATYQLTNLFYSHLDEGLPKDIALQRAKQDWLKSADGVDRLPNYWAGLIVVGDAEPLPNLHLALWGSFLALLLVGAGMILWYEHRKRRIKRPVSLPQPA